MKSYDRGDTAYITILHETYTLAINVWAAADPDDQLAMITIIDPDGEKQLLDDPNYEVAMLKKATGKYEYLYTIAADAPLGVWKGYIEVENDTYPDKKYFSFGVRN